MILIPPMLSLLPRLFHFILTVTIWSRYYPHCTSEKTEVQKVLKTCLKSYGQWTVKLETNPGGLTGEPSSSTNTLHFLPQERTVSFPLCSPEINTGHFGANLPYIFLDMFINIYLRNYSMQYSEICFFLKVHFFSILVNTLVKHFNGFIILYRMHKPWFS